MRRLRILLHLLEHRKHRDTEVHTNTVYPPRTRKCTPTQMHAHKAHTSTQTYTHDTQLRSTGVDGTITLLVAYLRHADPSACVALLARLIEHTCFHVALSWSVVDQPAASARTATNSVQCCNGGVGMMEDVMIGE